MGVIKLEKEKWKSCFDDLSKNLPAVEAQLEVIDEEVGDQVEVKYSPLTGLSSTLRMMFLRVYTQIKASNALTRMIL